MKGKNQKQKAALEKSAKEVSRLKDDDFKFKVGSREFGFERDLFSLEILNLGILNEQISKIPENLAQLGIALGLAERALATEKFKLDAWLAEKTTQFQELRSETAKHSQVMRLHKEKYEEYYNNVAGADYTVRLLKSFSRALESKYELAQTLSANQRAEMEKAYSTL